MKKIYLLLLIFSFTGCFGSSTSNSINTTIIDNGFIVLKGNDFKSISISKFGNNTVSSATTTPVQLWIEQGTETPLLNDLKTWIIENFSNENNSNDIYKNVTNLYGTHWGILNNNAIMSNPQNNVTISASSEKKYKITSIFNNNETVYLVFTGTDITKNTSYEKQISISSNNNIVGSIISNNSTNKLITLTNTPKKDASIIDDINRRIAEKKITSLKKNIATFNKSILSLSSQPINIVLYNGGADGTLGYYNSADIFTRDVNDSDFKYSNEGLYLYINSYYYSYYPDEVKSTLVHEFIHMITYYQRYLYNNYPVFDTWLNEMLAMIGEDYMADKLGLVGPRGIASLSSTTPTSYEVAKKYGRIYDFNGHNNYDINDKDGSFDAYDYSTSYAYGAYLIRNYNNPINTILNSQYGDYRAVEDVIGTNGFANSLKAFGKAVILSNKDQTTDLEKKFNFGNYITKTINGTTYNLGSINVYNYSTLQDFLYYGIGDSSAPKIQGGANIYYKLGSSLNNGSNSWTFNLPLGVEFQTIVVNSDGSYNYNKSTALSNSATVIN